MTSPLKQLAQVLEDRRDYFFWIKHLKLTTLFVHFLHYGEQGWVQMQMHLHL
jgi:hypothetical protein